jgi:ribosome recycling factor
MAGAIEAMEHDFITLRTGRASAALLEGVVVQAYGTPSPINQIATISIPDARSIMIQPWDRNMVAPIEKAILAANLGVTPNNDGRVIRMAIPQLTEDRRKDLVKKAHQMAEKCRVAVRNVRRHCNEELKRMEKAKEISENELGISEEKIQKITDGKIEEIDKRLVVKEKEIMEV